MRGGLVAGSDPVAIAQALCRECGGRALHGADLGALRAVRDALPARRMLVSIDVDDVRVLSRCAGLAGRPPLAALELLADEGVTEVMLLALRRVGTGAGPDLETPRAARGTHRGLCLIAGGGVRTLQDLQALADAGADGVLLATALHRGWITPAHNRAVRWDRRAPTSGL